MNSVNFVSVSSNKEKTRAFLDYIFPPPRPFHVRLWDDTCIEADVPAEFTFVFKHIGTLRRIFHPPVELSFSEAYIRGEFDIEGDLISAFSLLKPLSRTIAHNPLTLARLWLALPKDALHTENTGHIAQLSGSVHSRERDRAAVEHHYDVGNEFYALWLDKRMVYTCAYFPMGTEDIDTAQEAKLDLICRKLKLQPGETLLDVGCGWGGLVMYAAQKYGVKALGVTLSQQQYTLARQRIVAAGLDGCEVKLMDYRDVGGRTFDKIVSVGMFEQVGRSHLPEYFSHLYSLLKSGGLFLNHGISIRPTEWFFPHSVSTRLAKRFLLGEASFIQRYIFPDGQLEPVSEVNLFAEQAGFEVQHVENLREHYARTLRHWLRRLDEQHADAARLTSEAMYRTWRLYLASCAHGFDVSDFNINQTLLLRP